MQQKATYQIQFALAWVRFSTGWHEGTTRNDGSACEFCDRIAGFLLCDAPSGLLRIIVDLQLLFEMVFVDLSSSVALRLLVLHVKDLCNLLSLPHSTEGVLVQCSAARCRRGRFACGRWYCCSHSCCSNGNSLIHRTWFL